MKTSTKFTITAVVFAIVSLLLTRVIWPDLPDMIPPSAGELPFFMILSVIESITFGVGVAFICFGWRKMRAVAPGDARGALLSFLSVAWLMVSWWPHDSLHRITAEGDYVNLLRIEYGFHFSLMVAGLILAYYLWKLLKRV